MSTINFYTLIASSGNKDGARGTFEQVIAQVVRIMHPNVRRVEANPGDWGIDVFIGTLDEIVAVWQSKFFIDGVGDAQKQEIRNSFSSLMTKARENGFKVNVWTLCIPRSMNAKTTQWWDDWSKRKEKECSVKIELWDETELIRLLLSPDAAAIRSHYFGDQVAGQGCFPRPVEPIPDELTYEDMLFIKQLLAAGIIELDDARQQFFNHDLLAREVADKGIREEMEALRTCRAEVHSMWATRYNHRCQTSGSAVELPGLHADVMTAIEAHHNARHPSPLPMSLVHRLGSMHQVVDDGKAGWVRDYRAVARAHQGG